MKLVTSLISSLTIKFAVIAALAVPALPSFAQDFDSENIEMDMSTTETSAPSAHQEKKAKADGKKAKAGDNAHKKATKGSKKNNGHNKSKGKGHKKGHGKKKSAAL
jgi:Tfp pilus assembly protein FimT